MATSDDEATTAADLERWVRHELKLDDGAAIGVSEAPGTDPRCSPVVTVVEIAVPGQGPYSFHIERPLAELTDMDLIAALAFGGGH